jgi:hypothetical protein
MTVTWTTADEDRLRELWARGDTAKQIAHEMGYSRNAVLGKKMRLGLEQRESGGKAAEAARRAALTPEQLAVREQRRLLRLQKFEKRRLAREALAAISQAERRTQKQQAADHSQRQRLQAATTRKTKPIRVIAREGRLVEPLNLPFGDLDDNQKPTMCRYPTIKPAGEQLFCARPAEHGTSYCDDCCRVVYTADGYERQINKAPKLRNPAIGQVLIAAPFSNRDYNVVGLVREVPFS